MRLLIALLRQHWKRHPVLFTSLLLSSLVVAVLWVIEPLYSSSAVDKLLAFGQGEEVDLWTLGLWWAAIFIAVSIGQAVQKYLQWWSDMYLELDTIERAYHKVLRLPIAFHNAQKTGEAVKTIQDGADQLSYMLSRNALDLAMSVCSAITFLIISFTIDWRLALVLISVLCIFMLFVFFGTLKTAPLQQKANKLWVKPSGRQFDAIMNISSVKSGAQEEREENTVKALHAEGLGVQLKINRFWALLEAINFFMLTRILFAAAGVVLLARQELTLGEMYYFQFSFYRVLVPFEMLGHILPQWRRSVGKVEMMKKLLMHEEEDGHRKKGVIPQSIKGEIRFENVSFSYTKQELILEDDEERNEHHTHDVAAEAVEAIEENLGSSAPAHAEVPQDEEHEKAGDTATIRELPLTINAGEHLAIVGHSGAGKSTIAQLLNRFYDVTDGSILIDGTDLREIDVEWWRSQIGLVLQENLMFNDTVLENIRYARPHATHAEVEEAAMRAAASTFIKALQKGYNTEIGERGVKLSGGERQRLAIARAILKNPKIVVLDEATSALDSLTEAAVQQGIKELIKGRTAIIIAHRLSTVRACDRIAVMAEGKLIACAPHEELLKTCDIYRSMVELQQGGVLAEE